MKRDALVPHFSCHSSPGVGRIEWARFFLYTPSSAIHIEGMHTVQHVVPSHVLQASSHGPQQGFVFLGAARADVIYNEPGVGAMDLGLGGGLLSVGGSNILAHILATRRYSLRCAS